MNNRKQSARVHRGFKEADFENIFNKVFIYRNDIVKTDGIDEINAIQRHIVDIDDVYDDMKKNLILDEL